MIKAINAFCFVMLEVLAVMYCDYTMSNGYAIVLTLGFIVADIVFCFVYVAEVLENKDES